MIIREVQIDDANNYLNMLLQLDNETKDMMFEPGERPTDINIAMGRIKRSIEGSDVIIIAENNKKIVGFISAQRGSANRIKHTAYIVTGILKEYRGRKIGTEFIKKIDRWALVNNITRLELSVICTNLVAKHLYEKSGFQVEGLKKDAMIIDGKYVDEYYMAKLMNKE